MTDITVAIDRLGGGGDGIAETPAGKIFVPLSAPGDIVRVRPSGKDKARLLEVVTPGPARATPPCPHFGRCGGCALQHLDAQAIATWKREKIVTALSMAGLADAPVAETISIPAGTRRRATLAARRLRGGAVLGYAERASHTLIDVKTCPVLRPELEALLTPLRELATAILQAGETADFALTLTDCGIDLTMIRERKLDLTDRQTLGEIAQSANLVRISWRPSPTKPAETVIEQRAPFVRIAGLQVPFPSGAFLQPSAEGEATLIRLIAEGLGDAAAPTVDLFCGLGIFALPATASGAVAAFDDHRDSIAALQAIARKPALRGRLTAEHRDLFREPLSATELAPFEAAIIDPPRAGAAAQTAMLARSRVPVIAMASCNPASFARDAAVLVAGEYRLEKVTPIDQFLWSPHVELVAIFRR